MGSGQATDSEKFLRVSVSQLFGRSRRLETVNIAKRKGTVTREAEQMIKASGWMVMFTHPDGGKSWAKVVAWNDEGVAMIVDAEQCKLVDVFFYAVERFDDIPEIRLTLAER